MKKLRGAITLLALLTMLCPFNRAEAECCNYVTDTGGCAYDECRAATNLGPAIALGVVVLAAIIAVAVQNAHHTSTHTHAHIDCD